MKKGFYLRLALAGMGKNRRLYLPYLMTCSGMVAMFYVLSGLARSNAMHTVRGGSTMMAILSLGTIVIALFALLFLLYTNSFLARRRNREFGLYNVLGMNKGNLSRILLWETLLTALVSLLAGLAVGILLSKLAELFLLRMAGESVGYALTIQPVSILMTLVFFGVIFAVLLLVSLARVGISKPLDLLKSEAAGEKPPKANWVFAALGLAILGAAYYLSVTIDNPLSALFLFFAAVLMVILATYLLFITGSVALCKLLQRNKNYYYRSAHFVSVSSMAFRMKRNGAGLASICILATMVLVMLSPTACLFFGGENSIRGLCPYDVMLHLEYNDPADCRPEDAEQTLRQVRAVTGGREAGLLTYSCITASGLFENGSLTIDGYSRYVGLDSSPAVLEHVRTVYLLPLSDYNSLTGEERTLEPGEALIWSSGEDYRWDTLTLQGCRPLRTAGTLKDLPFTLSTEDTLVTAFCVFVPDWEERAAELHAFTASLQTQLVTADTRRLVAFHLPGVPEEEQARLAEELTEVLRNGREDSGAGWNRISCQAAAEVRSSFFSMNGSLFFLGIILSIVFLAAAALIIYYKQLSEGYEDQSRFGIMRKVGMTAQEIKSAVNSQVLTVFFAPLLLAGLHLAFAFPFVEKIVRVFGVTNTPLLILTSVVCYLAFALFYVFIYRCTARAYYSIVSTGE